MASTAKDFLTFAEVISKTDKAQEEIGQRAIVNRGYYAVYHLADDIADKMALPESRSTGGGSHQKLFDRLIECNVGPKPDQLILRSIGYIASRTLKPFRFWADYHLHAAQPSNAALQTLANAKKVFEKSASLTTL